MAALIVPTPTYAPNLTFKVDRNHPPETNFAKGLYTGLVIRKPENVGLFAYR